MKYTLLLLLVCDGAFCQTAGINTVNNTPAQVLQVSGAPSTSTAVGGTTGKFLVTPTMRVEGLNQTNNPVHPVSPAISTQPVYATALGDLVIGNRMQIIAQTIPGSTGLTADAIPSAITLNVPTGASILTTTLYTTTFTLKQLSLVHISASISVYFLTSTNTTITDGQAKFSGIQFQFSSVPAGSNIPTTVFASNTDSYSQTSVPANTNVPDGYFFYNLGKDLKLPAGTYTFNVIGCGSASSSGNAFKAFYGDATFDQVNITAITL